VRLGCVFREDRWIVLDGRTTATLVRTDRASQVRVTGGICANQASNPTTGMVLQLRERVWLGWN
jgi:hypothetical protein